MTVRADSDEIHWPPKLYKHMETTASASMIVPRAVPKAVSLVDTADIAIFTPTSAKKFSERCTTSSESNYRTAGLARHGQKTRMVNG